MEKHCKHCDTTKPVDQFPKDASRPDGRAYRCRDCERLRYTTYRQTEKGKAGRIRQVNGRKRRGAQWFDAYRRAHPCIICGEREIVCLDLHHLDPVNKIKPVSRMAFDGYSFEQLIDEAEKCVVLCANCHRKVHAGIVTIERELV